MSSAPQFETILLTFPHPSIALLTLNRPKKLNAMSTQMYHEIRSATAYLDQDPSTRCIIITGQAKFFCAGTDLTEDASYISEDPGRGALKAQIKLKDMQDCITSVENCRKPVIAAVSGYCIGVGFDLITACCIRYCSKSTVLSVREIRIGMAADMGTLERLPKIVGNQGWVRDIVYTGRDFGGEEGAKEGLFSEIFEDFEKTLEHAMRVAKEIAEKSPVAMIGCKVNCNYSMNHSVQESLDFVVRWNGWSFQSQDFDDSLAAQKLRKKTTYPKL